MEKKSTALHQARIRKIISDTIQNFYKQPKKYNRGDNATEYGDDPPATSFAERTNKSLTIQSGKKMGT